MSAVPSIGVNCSSSCVEPLVSVIIPVKNRAELITEALESLTKQTHRNWEAIVVDDHSTDGTFGKLETWARLDSRIKVYVRRGRRGGAPVCRNQGFAVAQGLYVIFLDSDDLLQPWCLQQRVQA